MCEASNVCEQTAGEGTNLFEQNARHRRSFFDRIRAFLYHEFCQVSFFPVCEFLSLVYLEYFSGGHHECSDLYKASQHMQQNKERDPKRNRPGGFFSC